MRLRKKHWAIPEMKENPYVFFDEDEKKFKWNEIFGNDNNIILEIGSGKGKFITEMAKNMPDKNFVMFEMESNAFVYATRKILDNELKNVRAVNANAEKIDLYFNKDEVSEIWINFCNPWPKKRHNKRRLTHPNFLKKYKKILKKNSVIHLKTDDLDFFKDSLDYFVSEGFKIIEIDYDLQINPSTIITEYESKWRNKGIKINYASFTHC